MCTRLALPAMQSQGSGNIINIASVAPWLGRGTIDYNAAKSGVLAITRSIARQYGPKGIRCNTIAPSVHKTPMAEKVMASEEGIDYIDAIPLGFVPGPDSVAKAALFLASDDSYYISGHTLLVDGGLTLRSVGDWSWRHSKKHSRLERYSLAAMCKHSRQSLSKPWDTLSLTS